jgi:hypothetical protein
MIPPVAMPTTKAVMPIAIHKRGTPKAFLLQFIPRYFQNGGLLSFSVHGLEKTSGDSSNATSNPAAGATSIPPIEKWGFLDHESLEDIILKGKRPSDAVVYIDTRAHGKHVIRWKIAGEPMGNTATRLNQINGRIMFHCRVKDTSLSDIFLMHWAPCEPETSNVLSCLIVRKS